MQDGGRLGRLLRHSHPDFDLGMQMSVKNSEGNLTADFIMRNTHQCFAFSVLVLLATALLPGCRSNQGKVTVEGAVSVDAKSVEDGAINFTPLAPTKGPSVGAKIIAGRYRIDGEQNITAGKYRVSIVGTRKTGKQVPDMMRPGKSVDAIEQFIPRKYNTESKLEIELSEGENKNVDFNLKM